MIFGAPTRFDNLLFRLSSWFTISTSSFFPIYAVFVGELNSYISQHFAYIQNNSFSTTRVYWSYYKIAVRRGQFHNRHSPSIKWRQFLGKGPHHFEQSVVENKFWPISFRVKCYNLLMRMTLSRNEISRQKSQMNVTSTLFYFIKSLLDGKLCSPV